jgi:hypothetical protein
LFVIAFHKDNYKLTELLRKRSSACQERGSSSPREQQQLTQRGAASPKSNKQGFKSCNVCSDKINTKSHIAKPHIFMTNPQTTPPYTLWGGFVWGMEFCVSRGCTRMAISNHVLLKKMSPIHSSGEPVPLMQCHQSWTRRPRTMFGKMKRMNVFCCRIMIYNPPPQLPLASV